MKSEAKSRGKIIVFGIVFWYQLTGVTYQVLHYLIGLRRLGYDICYIKDSRRNESSSNPAYTAITTWHNKGKDIEYREETYYWTKDREFIKVIDLPLRCQAPLDLALGMQEIPGTDAEVPRRQGRVCR